ncbi:MAG: DUF89 domain-containing protein, partial [Promethearchaeota archaeon]
VPCLLKQMLQATKMVNTDIQVQDRVLRAGLDYLAKNSWSISPALLAEAVHRLVREITGKEDPYFEVKRIANLEVLEFYPRLKNLVQTHPDPLLAAVKGAIAGNIIDYAPFADKMSPGSLDFESIVNDIINRPFAKDSFLALKKALMNAETLLFLADNAGEIVFDRVLLEQLQAQQENSLDITFIVKAQPFLNDAMLIDAEQVGLQNIPNLTLKPMNLPLDSLNPKLLQRFRLSDITISKGQANYELFSEYSSHFFLLMAKCPVIAQDLGVSVGDLIVYLS